MSTSASESNKKDQKNLTFFRTSDTGYSSEHGLFNSSGQLLEGKENFVKHSELAKQLDTKRSVFHLQLKENEIIFGCSLIVKAANGREERVVFIQVYEKLSSGYKIESDIELLKRFYKDMQFEIETLELKKYQLVGLWNEGDFQNIEEVEIERGIKYTLGKISTGRKVSIKISELSSGLSLILELIARMKSNLTLVFDVSQFPSEFDVSVSLIKPNPDFEIDENGHLQNSAISESWTFYEKLGDRFYKTGSHSRRGQKRSDNINPIVQVIMDDLKKYCNPSNPIFNDYDDEEKIDIFSGLIQKINKNNNNDIRKILRNIYDKVSASKSKKDIHIMLLSKNIYIDELLKDLILKEIYEKHNKDFFDVLFNENTSPDVFVTDYSDMMSDELDEQQINKVAGQTDDKIEKKQKRKSSDKAFNIWEEKQKKGKNDSTDFEKRVKNILENLEVSQKTDFVKFIAQESRSKPEEKGKILLNILVNDLAKQDMKKLISELNVEELEKIDDILGTHYQSIKKEQNKNKRNRIIWIVSRAGILIVIILAALYSFNFLMGFIPNGDSGVAISSPGDNQTNKSGLSENTLEVTNNDSISNNQTNNITSNVSEPGITANNSTSDNQTSNITSNVSEPGITVNNSTSDNQTK